MLEAKAKDQGHKAQVLSKKKKKVFTKIFQAISKKKKKKKKKKVFTKIFQAISTKKRFPKNFSAAPQNFNFPKNSAVLEPRTGQFSRTWGLEAKAKDLTFEAKAKAKDFKICPRGQGRPRGLHLWLFTHSFYRHNHAKVSKVIRPGAPRAKRGPGAFSNITDFWLCELQNRRRKCRFMIWSPKKRSSPNF